ncbi:hypothetical protein RFI_35777, partial [Reticulomyxa filosa]
NSLKPITSSLSKAHKDDMFIKVLSIFEIKMFTSIKLNINIFLILSFAQTFKTLLYLVHTHLVWLGTASVNRQSRFDNGDHYNVFVFISLPLDVTLFFDAGDCNDFFMRHKKRNIYFSDVILSFFFKLNTYLMKTIYLYLKDNFFITFLKYKQ